MVFFFMFLSKCSLLNVIIIIIIYICFLLYVSLTYMNDLVLTYVNVFVSLCMFLYNSIQNTTHQRKTWELKKNQVKTRTHKSIKIRFQTEISIFSKLIFINDFGSGIFSKIHNFWKIEGMNLILSIIYSEP